eukprot:scaffold148835_cov21-Prasinocladus_malaysianus.AAC.1
MSASIVAHIAFGEKFERVAGLITLFTLGLYTYPLRVGRGGRITAGFYDSVHLSTMSILSTCHLWPCAGCAVRGHCLDFVCPSTEGRHTRIAMIIVSAIIELIHSVEGCRMYVRKWVLLRWPSGSNDFIESLATECVL